MITEPIYDVRETGAGETSLAAVGVVALSMVHDLRNPLAAIHGCAEMAIRGGLAGSQSGRLARNIYDASLRMQDVLEEFMEVCRKQGTRRELYSLRELVLDAVEEVSAAAQAQSVRIIGEIPEDLILPLDRYRIASVFRNLFANALEAMPGGGLIDVSARSMRDSILIEVRDTGPGVDPAILERLFQPFVTSGKPSGLGLGLASSRQAVAAHDGDLWLAPSRGQGACFAFSLPKH